MKLRLLCLSLFAASISLPSLAQTNNTQLSTQLNTRLSTHAERSQYKETGSYAEVIALCKQFQSRYPQFVKCTQFGTTPEGRPMMALIASRTGALTAQQTQQKKWPVVLIQGGIHAGEIDGKDAIFWALRDALENKAAQGALEKQVVVFVPVFNVDGHERFGPWNRPNQRGPEQMGWRTTAQNFNLNRDYVKADAPEMQAMLNLVNTWDPLATIDLHVTDGAKFEHDISIQVEPAIAGPEPLRKAGQGLRDAVIKDIAKQGSLPQHFYMSFLEEDNPMSGFADNVSTPRFSTGYFQLRNRLGMLVETHSWKDYPTRVRITRNTIISVLNQVAQHGKQWRDIVNEQDKIAAQQAGQLHTLTYKNTEEMRQIDFRGYAYTRTVSDISGALMTRYDETKPQIWRVNLQEQVTPDIQVRLPLAGYIVPAAYAQQVAEKLKQHAIDFERIHQTQTNVELDTFRANQVTFSTKSIEQHQTLKLAGVWKKELRTIPNGSLFVPIQQSKAKLIATLFEPQAEDALVNWGWFNNAYEAKEYMEAYVAEDVARDMLAHDSNLKSEFESRIANDPNFAKNPAARLSFFAKRHSSWDNNYQLYPVMRADKKPNLK